MAFMPGSEKPNNHSDMMVAKQKVLKAIPYVKVIRGLDYNDYFVFVVEPMMLGLISVSKRDGNVGGFNPMLNDPESYFKVAEKNMVDLE